MDKTAYLKELTLIELGLEDALERLRRLKEPLEASADIEELLGEADGGSTPRR